MPFLLGGRETRALLAALALVASSTLAEAQAPRSLPRVELEYPKPFTRVAGVRELRDGRVVVLDAQDQSIHLVDLRTGSGAPIGKQGDGPGEFRLPLRLLAVPGDTTAIHDMVRPFSMLLIGPDGRPGGSRSIEGVDGGLVTRVNVDAADGMGRFYGKANIGRALGDSVEIVRLDPRSGRWTPVVMICNKGVSELRPSWGCSRGAAAPTAAGPVRMTGGVVPFSTVDQWAVAPGWSHCAGIHRSLSGHDGGGPRAPVVGPVLAAAPIRLTDAHREAWRRERQRPVATISSSGGQTVTSYRRSPIPPPTEWPTHLLPFLPGALTCAPDGTLWVLRTTADASVPPPMT